MSQRALITGVNGMVGSHMADFLLDKGYEVYGTSRNIRSLNNNSKQLIDKINFIQVDLTDQSSIYKAILESQPHEIYNFGAISFAPDSWITPEHTANVNGVAVLSILEAIRQSNKNIKFYQAGTSEIFGNLKDTTATEETVPYPKSPYGVAKLYAQWIVRNYRESYGIFACNGIAFNHESERRGAEFVTRKITKAVAEIKLGLRDHIELGNLNITRDWGYSPDYVEAMWMMMQLEKPDDYIISTNKSHSLEYLLEIAFKAAGINDFKTFIQINPAFVRNTEIHNLKGDYSRINNRTGWFPKTSFEEMIIKMVEYDLNNLK